MPGMCCALRVRCALVLAALALLAGCGPTPREAAIAVLAAAVGIVGLSNVLVRPLFALWRRLRPDLTFRWIPFLMGGATLSALGVVLGLTSVSDPLELTLLALWGVGTSYLAFLLVAWRVGLDSRNGLAVAHLVAGSLMFLPALALALFGATESQFGDVLFYVWLAPGYGGVVPGVIFLALLVEVLVRRHRAPAPAATLTTTAR